MGSNVVIRGLHPASTDIYIDGHKINNVRRVNLDFDIDNNVCNVIHLEILVKEVTIENTAIAPHDSEEK